MRVRAVLAWVAVGALAIQSWSAPAQAVPVEAWIVYESQSLPGNPDVVVDIPVVTDALGISRIENWRCNLRCSDAGFRITDLDLVLDPDPVISFGFSVLDLGGPSNFAFVVQQSIVPTAAPGTATSSFSGSTTNGGGGPGSVTVTPLSPPGFIPQDAPGTTDELMVYTLSTDGGATWQNAGIDLGPAFTSNPLLVSDNYGAYNAGPVAGPAGTGFYDAMRVDVNFSLSGGGDTFTFNGDATINEDGTIVPEPATAAQLALGLLAVALVRRRGTHGGRSERRWRGKG